jgi:hypothetical protein
MPQNNKQYFANNVRLLFDNDKQKILIEKFIYEFGYTGLVSHRQNKIDHIIISEHTEDFIFELELFTKENAQSTVIMETFCHRDKGHSTIDRYTFSAGQHQKHSEQKMPPQKTVQHNTQKNSEQNLHKKTSRPRQEGAKKPYVNKPKKSTPKHNHQQSNQSNKQSA